MVKAEDTLEEKYRLEDYWFPDGTELPLMVLSEKINGTYVLKENGSGLPKGILAYCFDYSKNYPDLVEGYNMYNPLDKVDSFSSPGKLRAIMLKGFPNKSVEEISAETGISGIDQGMALNATQYAIWYYTNGPEYGWETWKFYNPGEQAKALYEYLINLQPINGAPYEVAEIEFSSQNAVFDENENLILTVTVGASEDNYDGSAILPDIDLDEATKAKYPNATLEKVNDGNKVNVTITIPSEELGSLDENISIGFSYNFEQLVEDLFILPPKVPENGVQRLGAVTINTLKTDTTTYVSFDIPEEPTPEEPTEPEEPTTDEPSDSETPGEKEEPTIPVGNDEETTSGDNHKQSTEDKKEDPYVKGVEEEVKVEEVKAENSKLPQTDGRNNPLTIVVGLLLVLISSILLNRKKEII